MIPNHAQFLDAVRTHTLLRIAFYSTPDSGVVDRECAPLDYAPGPDENDPANRYWVWDAVATAGPNPLGLLPGQIVSVTLLGKTFAPAEFKVGSKEPSSSPPPAAQSSGATALTGARPA